MLYLSYTRRLTPQARSDMGAFWAWLEEREAWFYRDLPMVEETRWYYSVVGEAYQLENRTAFADEAAFGAYRSKLAEMRADPSWEAERVAQEAWWVHERSSLLTDPPAAVGLRRGGG